MSGVVTCYASLWITLSVSAQGMKIIDKKWLARVVAEMRAAGGKI